MRPDSGASRPPSVLSRGAFACAAIFFAYALAVQFNDVDGPIWIALYLVPSVIALVAALQWPTALVQRLPIAAAALAAVAVPWGLTLLPEALKVPSFVESEVAREVGGLAIVGTFALGVAWSGWRAKKQSLRAVAHN